MLNKLKDAIKKLFGFVDTNNDGKIDLAEINVAVDKVEVQAKAAVAKADEVVKKARGRKPKAK